MSINKINNTEIPDPKAYFDMASRKNWQGGYYKKLVDFILEKHQNGEVKNILELGCGMAEILEYLPENIKYFGIDPNTSCINKLNSLKNINNLFFVANAENLPLKDDFFDLVFSTNVIEHMYNPRKAIIEARRVLKKNGYFVIFAPNYELPRTKIRAIRHYSRAQRFWFNIKRNFSFLIRLTGFLSFQIIDQNYTEKTGKYEIKDDDLKYVASSYEIEQFLKRNNFKELYTSKFETGNDNFKNQIKKIVSILPPYRNIWSSSIYLVFQKK